ncbi:MAG: hypothetical protein OXI96_10370 [Acidimicrobiaceae bacterium]|nr:hypothetical protein [Acidimicrobiaceae bacterium]
MRIQKEQGLFWLDIKISGLSRVERGLRLRGISSESTSIGWPFVFDGISFICRLLGGMLGLFWFPDDRLGDRKQKRI